MPVELGGVIENLNRKHIAQWPGEHNRVFPVTATFSVLWHDFAIEVWRMYNQGFPPSSANRQGHPAPTTLELSELLTRAKAAIDQAREQVQKTHALLAECKEKRESETWMGRSFVPR